MHQFSGEEAELNPNGHTATIQHLYREVEIMSTEEKESFAVSSNSLRQLVFSVSSVDVQLLPWCAGSCGFQSRQGLDSRSSLFPEKEKDMFLLLVATCCSRRMLTVSSVVLESRTTRVQRRVRLCSVES